MLFIIILIILYGIGIIANGIVILVVLTLKKMRKSSMNILLLNLALSDLCMLTVNAIYLVPKLSGQHHHQHMLNFSIIYCRFHTFSTGVCGLVSILSYMAICIERYIVIVCPLHATLWCTRDRTVLAINFVWAFSIMYRLPYFDLAGTEIGKYGCFLEFLPFHWVSEFLLIHLSVFVVSSLLYYKICKVLWSVGFPAENTENKINKRRTLLKVLIFCFVLYFFCSFASILLVIICEFNGLDILRYAIRLFSLQSALNPFIYTMIGKNFRENCYKFFFH